MKKGMFFTVIMTVFATSFETFAVGMTPAMRPSISGEVIVTPLNGDQVIILTDTLGKYILIPKVPVVSQDGRKTRLMGDNVFVGGRASMLNATFDKASSRGEVTSIDFLNDGNLTIIRTSRKIESAILTCGQNQITLVHETTFADQIAQTTTLKFHSDRRLHQVDRLWNGKYYVVDKPDQNASLETFRYWYGKPGKMEQTERSGIGAHIGLRLSIYSDLPEFGIPGLSGPTHTNSVCDYFL